MSRWVEGERLDDACEMFHNHRWETSKPWLSGEQMSELLVVLRDWYREEFTPKRAPVSRPAKTKMPKSKPDRGSQSEGRRLVYARSGGWCEIGLTTAGCTGSASEWHHRLNRSQGGRWDASNGLHVCGACHDYVTNRERVEAKRMGWAVPPGVTPPCEVPVLRRGVAVYLDDEGGFEPVNNDVAGLSGVEGGAA